MLDLFIHSLGLILVVLVLLHHLAWWQRKEYRWDRLLVEIVTLSQSRTLPFLRRGLSRPRPTVKAQLIAAAAGLILLLVFIALNAAIRSVLLLWLLTIILTPIAVAAAVAVGNAISSWPKNRVIKQAQKIRAASPRLTVIGITGSFGKTSTKYFLHHLLGASPLAHAMSAARRNEAYVIAQDMVQNLTPQTATYVLEMGAYKRGEIKKIANLAQPVIGVITAIRNQHLALFGSPEDLVLAKWELIMSLPSHGIAVLNADDPAIRKKSKSYSGQVIWYSAQRQADVYVDQVMISARSFTATFHIMDAQQTITIPLAGAGYLNASVAASAAAHAANLPTAAIFARLSALKPIPQTMSVTSNGRGATIIDDSYSASEDGVLLAVRHLYYFSEPQKIVVLRPLIELGAETKRAHRVIAQALAATGARVLLYDTPGAADIERAVHTAGPTGNIQRIATPSALARAVQEAAVANTVVLLENRLPEIVRQAALA